MSNTIEIIHVDQGDILLKFSSSMPANEVIETIESQLNTPFKHLVLYNSEGYLIDESSFQWIKENSQVFLFRRDSVVTDCLIAQPHWESFKDFPAIDTYELPFFFHNYEKFPTGYEKVPKIEKYLYELYCISKQLYAKFMVKLEYVEKCKTFIETRLKASYVLLKNLKFYYKDIKFYWKNVFSKSSELLREYNYADLHFSEQHDQLMANNTINPLFRFVKEAKLKKFAFDASRKAKVCCKKIHELKSKFLSKIKVQLVNSTTSAEKVSLFYQFSSKMYSNFNINNKQAAFVSLLKVCQIYSDCRSNIDRIFDKNYKNKRKALNKILELEKQLNYYKELSLQQNIVLNEIEPIVNAINECIYRASELYKEKIIAVISESAQKLKHKVKLKIDKLNTTLKTLMGFKDFINLPNTIELASSASEELRRSHKENQRQINGIYSKICDSLIIDNEARKHFLTCFGEILPQKAYEELVTPIFPEKLIQKILNIEYDTENDEVEPKTVNTEDIVAYYEKEIQSFEGVLKKTTEDYKIKERNIQNEIIEVIRNIDEIEEQMSNTENLIKNHSQELELLKGRGGVDRYQKNLRDEVEKIKEKEAAFKGVFMEQLQELHQLNTRLRHSLT